jgi:DHA2 family multidrug resistance protein
VMAPVGILAIIGAPIVGRNLTRWDSRIVASIAFVVFGLVMWMRSRFTPDVDFQTILIPTVVQGIAMACFFIPLITLAFSGLRPDQLPAAGGLLNFARITMGSFGTSISTTLWDHRATLHHAQLVERLTAYDPATTQALASMQASGLSPEQALASLNHLVDQQAALMSATDIFRASALLFLLLIAVVWFTKPVRAATGGAEASAAH